MIYINLFYKYIKYLLLIFMGFSSGIIISGAVFAFISTLGLTERLARKTLTQEFIYLYEEIIIFGGIFGMSTNLINYYIPLGKLLIGKILICFLSFCNGIFYGCLAMSLAEMLNVIPVLIRRGSIHSGLRYFIFAIALGKLIGSLLYYLIPGFHH